MNEGNKVAGVV